MRRFTVTSLAVMLLALSASGVRAAPVLFDFGLNLDGVLTTLADPLPAAVDASSFDFATGLGAMSITFAPGAAGDYFVGAFFDHEIDETVNTFFNEFGAVSGTPAAGQSWEIDEPGFAFGDIFTHFLAGALDDTNGVPAGLDDDVSLAMGFDVSLAADEFAVIDFLVSETTPAGFFLSHTDPDSDVTLYFSGNVLSGKVQALPEPGAGSLLGIGLVVLLVLGRKRLRGGARG